MNESQRRLKRLQIESVEDIPLDHAVFVVSEETKGAAIIPELTSFQVDGRLYDVRRLDEDFLEEELLSSLDQLHDLLNTEEEQHS